MKALIRYSSEGAWGNKERTEEIETIKQLIDLRKKEGYDLIISDRYLGDGEADFYIEVYDAYRE